GSTVNPNARVARSANLGPNRVILFLATAFDRREYEVLATFWQRHDAVDHFVSCLRAYWDLTVRAIRLPKSCIEHAQIVIDFGDGADRRSRTLAGRFLFNRDRRRQSFNAIDLGLLNLAQKLTSVARQRFDVSTLPFGINCVDRKATLSRTAWAGADRHAFTWN